jgi:hypothetical protein
LAAQIARTGLPTGRRRSWSAHIPLPSDVGAAPADWLRHGRRPSTCREVFTCVLGPVAPINKRCQNSSTSQGRLTPDRCQNSSTSAGASHRRSQAVFSYLMARPRESWSRLTQRSMMSRRRRREVSRSNPARLPPRWPRAGRNCLAGVRARARAAGLLDAHAPGFQAVPLASSTTSRDSRPLRHQARQDGQALRRPASRRWRPAR